MEGVRVDICLGRPEYFIRDLAHRFVYFKHDAA